MFAYDVSGVNGKNRTGPVDTSSMNITNKSSIYFDYEWTRTVGDKPHALFDMAADSAETTNVADENAEVVRGMLVRLSAYADLSPEPLQWNKPYQGGDYECADCPRRPASGPNEPWLPWVDE